MQLHLAQFFVEGTGENKGEQTDAQQDKRVIGEEVYAINQALKAVKRRHQSERAQQGEQQWKTVQHVLLTLRQLLRQGFFFFSQFAHAAVSIADASLPAKALALFGQDTGQLAR